MAADRIRIHSAPWVVPVCAPPIGQGSVAIAHGKILAVNNLAAVQQRYPQAEVIDHPRSILTPALINGHIHLELSHLAGLAESPLDTSFTGWITRLLELREGLGAVGYQVEQAAGAIAEQQYNSGVCVLADIGNTGIGRSLSTTFSGRLMAFREYLGLAEFTLEKNFRRLSQEEETTFCCGHAPYSTHSELLQKLKTRANQQGHVFPLHVAEPVAEGEMIRQGRGEMVDFVRHRGFWDGSFLPRGSGGSIDYLHEIGVLDHRTVCVHAIHVAADEIRIMAGEGVKVCLCPGSNRFLGTGRAPVRAYLDHGLLPALGTDSLASNPELSLWREMQLLAEDHPAVQPDEIFRMATLGGAQTLQADQHLGTLAPDKEADMLAVPCSETLPDAEAVYRFLVQGRPSTPVRIQH